MVWPPTTSQTGIFTTAGSKKENKNRKRERCSERTRKLKKKVEDKCRMKDQETGREE
jgi:hypothetical protein